jgi:hypothetical protein
MLIQGSSKCCAWLKSKERLNQYIVISQVQMRWSLNIRILRRDDHSTDMVVRSLGMVEMVQSVFSFYKVLFGLFQ